MYVSDTDKNEDYWAKRVKNNVAARRSREARRLKENQVRNQKPNLGILGSQIDLMDQIEYFF